jgi:hypothetical protein
MAFLDNLDNLSKTFGKKVTDTYKTAAKKSSEILEQTRLKIAISSEEEKRNELFALIGKRTYEIYQSGEDEPENISFKEEFDRISEITNTINDMKQKILEMKSVKACPECNEEIDIACEFCPKCGAKQDPISEETTEIKNKICTKCDMEYDLECNFCSKCGSKLK